MSGADAAGRHLVDIGDRKAGRDAGEGTAVSIVLPSQLRELAGGRAAIRVEARGGTLRGAFDALRAALPAVYDRIVTEQAEIRPHINVFVDGLDIRWTGGWEAPLDQGSEVIILRAVSGG